jgi:hypothetical protein
MGPSPTCTIDAPGRGRGAPLEQRAHRDSIFVEDGRLRRSRNTRASSS